MPELPEVETMRRGIAAIAGSRIVRIDRPPCRLRPIQFTPRFDRFCQRLEDRLVVAVGRRGKRILLHLDDASVVVIEPRMTGLVLVGDPPNHEHLRMRIALQRPSESRGAAGHSLDALLFWDRRGLGTVSWFSQQQGAIRLGEPHVGPDALEITTDQLRARLGESRRLIKVALLDQRALAGVGNLYAAEILHVAGIDPRLPCHRLTGPQWLRLHAALRHVLREAIQHEGSTLSDGTYRNALNQSGNYQNHHRVYDRAGLACPRCGGGPIRRIVQAQRSTFFCPDCQRRSGCHAAVDRQPVASG